MLISISRIEKWEKGRKISKLIEALHTNDDDLRQAICLILGSSKSVHAIKSLQYIEENDSNEFVKIAAHKSLKHLMANIEFEELESQIINEQTVLSPVHAF